MSVLTTHVLDVARGRPAAGVGIALFALGGATPRALGETITNADGRTDSPLASDLVAGTYEIVFAVGAYFARADRATMFEDIPIRFVLEDEGAHHHVPLLLSPFGYSTYRGS